MYFYNVQFTSRGIYFEEMDSEVRIQTTRMNAGDGQMTQRSQFNILFISCLFQAYDLALPNPAGRLPPFCS